MSPTFASHLDALGAWRRAVETRLADLARAARESDLLDESSAEWFDAMRLRLAGDKLMVAFVAEFSRGKSELINAIFFSGSGRRMLPATPGRTTMCPVELGYDADLPVGLSLLPIETRLESASLAELRVQRRHWKQLPLDLQDPDAMAQALSEVMHTRKVPQDEARALGFWDDEQPQNNPPLDEQGMMEVPAWRHAVINLPHPLLKRGLVVLDTPGLNAVGTEAELTLGLLPSAHATVFILGADTGVTKSDFDIWRDYLSGPGMNRFVALNKIDALADPLSTPEEVESRIHSQCEQVAQMLGIERSAVFPIAARQALAARVAGDAEALKASRIEVFEQALADQLLPKRRATLEQATLEGVGQLQTQLNRKLGDQRRQWAEQLLELRGLRGKSGGKVQVLLQRAQAEAKEFEQSTAMLGAIRSVHNRMLKDTLLGLSGTQMREPVEAFFRSLQSSFLPLNARKSFVQMCSQLRGYLDATQRRCDEIHTMLGASFAKLNAEFGFSLSLEPALSMRGAIDDLAAIERNYVQYFGLTQALRLAQQPYQVQFKRMLLSRLRVVFENAASTIELWNKSASALVDTQLRDRRRAFKRRHEALTRVQSATGELESRIQELEAQDQATQQLQQRIGALIEAVVREAQGVLPAQTEAAAGAPLRSRQG